MTVGMLALDKLPVAHAPQILVVNSADPGAEERIMAIVKKHSHASRVKSRNMTGNTLDMVLELRTEAGSKLLSELMAAEGITSASLLAHDGEVTF